MSLRKFFTPLLIISALLTALPLTGQTTVRMQLDRSEILVGEQARLTATVNTAANSRVVWPVTTPGDTLVGGVEVVRAEKADTAFSDGRRRMTLRRTYLITSFDSALYAIPPLRVEVDGKVIPARGRCGLKVVPVPVDTVHVNDIAPPFTSLEHPFAWQYDLLLTALPLWAIVVLVLFFAIRISMFKPIRRRVTLPPPTPPLQRAREALAEIKAMNTDDDAANKAYFVRLTEVVRTYLNDRYGCAAMEKTTREIMDEMSRDHGLTPQQLLELRTLLDTADYVKFARSRPGSAECRSLMERMEQFLLQTHDETMEHPAPIVRIVTLPDGTQRGIKAVLIVLGIATTAAGIALTAYTIWRICVTYF